jgi:hypothetical protein
VFEFYIICVSYNFTFPELLVKIGEYLAKDLATESLSETAEEKRLHYVAILQARAAAVSYHTPVSTTSHGEH